MKCRGRRAPVSQSNETSSMPARAFFFLFRTQCCAFRALYLWMSTEAVPESSSAPPVEQPPVVAMATNTVCPCGGIHEFEPVRGDVGAPPQLDRRRQKRSVCSPSDASLGPFRRALFTARTDAWAHRLRCWRVRGCGRLLPVCAVVAPAALVRSRPSRWRKDVLLTPTQRSRLLARRPRAEQGHE